MRTLSRLIAGLVVVAGVTVPGIVVALVAPIRQMIAASTHEPVRRVTDALPLARQSEVGVWEAVPELGDEFDGSELDRSKWHATNPEWEGRQPGFYAEENVRVADGRLRITMRRDTAPAALAAKGYRDWSSGAVQSRALASYGYYEIRAKAMGSSGSSAFWFYRHTPTSWTEIDVFEIFARSEKKRREVTMTLHLFDPVSGHDTPREAIWRAPFDLDDDFHVYGLAWSADEIAFDIDGVTVHRTANTHWHEPLSLNLDSETMEVWAGLPRDADLPSTFEIDYVRAWRRK